MKMTVHNAMEARVLIREMNVRGEFHEFIQFFTHDGKYLGAVNWNDATQEIEALI